VIRRSGEYVERRWIEENEELFKKIFSNESAEIYQVVWSKERPEMEG